MSYSIKTRVYQSNPNAYFQIVEIAAWNYANGGTWAEQGGTHTLTMGGSGTSGMLRFMTEKGGELFYVAMGVHNYKPWIDIVPDLAHNITCVTALPEYYSSSNREKCAAREAQRTSQSVTNAEKRNIAANFKVAEGQNLELDIVIG